MHRVRRAVQFTGNPMAPAKIDNSSSPRPRGGRPPAPKDRVRSHRIVTFVTPPQMEQLNKLAERRESSMSKLVHELLSESLTQLRITL
jgi:hypothetical protein